MALPRFRYSSAQASDQASPRRKVKFRDQLLASTQVRQGRISRARDRAREGGRGEPVIIINAWKEWSEGMYLLPEKRTGTRYLGALHAALEENQS